MLLLSFIDALLIIVRLRFVLLEDKRLMKMIENISQLQKCCHGSTCTFAAFVKALKEWKHMQGCEKRRIVPRGFLLFFKQVFLRVKDLKKAGFI